MMLVTDLIATDHRAIQQLFFEVEEARPPAREPLERLMEELELHAHAEEMVFYTAIREVSRRTDDAEAGHAHMRALMQAVMAAEPASREFAQALLQLKQTVLNHAMEEEAGVFMDAQRLGLEKLAELATAMEEQKQTLREAQPARGRRAA